jgi:hypothetical protein
MNEEKRKSMKDKLPPEAVEHMKAAHAEMRKSVEAILPPGFVEHRRTARREMLLAFRSMIGVDKTAQRLLGGFLLPKRPLPSRQK